VIFTDKYLVGIGSCLVALGVGFLLATQHMLDMRDPFVIGGFFWSIIGGITIGFGWHTVDKKTKQLNTLG
jgi:hypothetical protein